MNKRNSILESLSEGMITTANSKEVSKSNRAKLFCETVVKMRNGYLEDIYDVFGVITSSITKYTKPVFGKLTCDNSLLNLFIVVVVIFTLLLIISLRYEYL